MKKLIVLLMAVLLCMPAWAETAEFLVPFVIAAPQGVTAAEGAGGASVVYVHENGTTRVVATVISRVPDTESDHAAELRRLMAQYAPKAQSGVPLTLTAGFHGLKAVTPGALEGMNGALIDQVTVMVLWQTAMQGELLILSGYDMAGDAAKAEALIDALLAAATVNNAPILPADPVPGE